MPGVFRRAGVDGVCCFQEGVQGAVSVLPEGVVLGAPLVVAPLLLPPFLESYLGRWEFLENLLIVLLGVYGFG